MSSPSVALHALGCIAYLALEVWGVAILTFSSLPPVLYSPIDIYYSIALSSSLPPYTLRCFHTLLWTSAPLCGG